MVTNFFGYKSAYSIGAVFSVSFPFLLSYFSYAFKFEFGPIASTISIILVSALCCILVLKTVANKIKLVEVDLAFWSYSFFIMLSMIAASLADFPYDVIFMVCAGLGLLLCIGSVNQSLNHNNSYQWLDDKNLQFFDNDVNGPASACTRADRNSTKFSQSDVSDAFTTQLSRNNIHPNGGMLDFSYIKIKRVTELILTILVLPFLACLALVVAAIVYIVDGGPVLFTQKRVGLRGKYFTAYKFRTMRDRSALENLTRSASHKENLMMNPDVTRINDARITRLGNLLRKTRLDELPQVLNILKGEMSWIGPRPETVSLSMIYKQNIPRYEARYSVLPGITGWAQTNQGHVTDLDAIRKKQELDLHYINNMSLWLDIKIVFKTITVMFIGTGAK